MRLHTWMLLLNMPERHHQCVHMPNRSVTSMRWVHGQYTVTRKV